MPDTIIGHNWLLCTFMKKKITDIQGMTSCLEPAEEFSLSGQYKLLIE